MNFKYNGKVETIPFTYAKFSVFFFGIPIINLPIYQLSVKLSPMSFLFCYTVESFKISHQITTSLKLFISNSSHTKLFFMF